jgi:hypothetical protein
MLSFMQAGFIVTAGGLLPQLLAFHEMSHRSLLRGVPASSSVFGRSLSAAQRRRLAQPPHLAPFALALTVMLLTTGVAYLIALASALR